MNEWFTPQDFLNLMHDKENRSIIYREHFVFKDENHTKLFTHETKGILLKEPKGNHPQSSWSLVSLRNDGKSIAEAWEAGLDPVTDYGIWEEIAAWYKKISNP